MAMTRDRRPRQALTDDEDHDRAIDVNRIRSRMAVRDFLLRGVVSLANANRARERKERDA